MSDLPRVGVMVPTFRESPSDAIALAVEAEQLGIDGVFVYDHLWPMGRPDRPALAPFPVLGAMASQTTALCLGTLVARVGVVPDDLLVSEFLALRRLAPERVIAGIGTGDHLSFNENRAYGLAIAPSKERRDSIRRCATSLLAEGLEVWVGGLARSTIAVAEAVGATANFWQVPADRVAEQAGRSSVSWAGMAAPDGRSGDVDLAGLLSLGEPIARAGASWLVFGWPVSLEALALARRALRSQT